MAVRQYGLLRFLGRSSTVSIQYDILQSDNVLHMKVYHRPTYGSFALEIFWIYSFILVKLHNIRTLAVTF